MKKRRKIAMDSAMHKPTLLELSAPRANKAPKQKQRGSQSFNRFKDLLDRTEQGKEFEKPQQSTEPVKGMTRHSAPQPKFERRVNETTEQFMTRVNEEVAELVLESHHQEVNESDMVKGDDGKYTFVHHNPYGKKKKKEMSEIRKMRKAEKKDWQLETKLMKMDKNKTGFEHLTDEVDYLETVHEPPRISKKPKRAVQAGVESGKGTWANKGLHLMELLQPKKEDPGPGSSKSKSTFDTKKHSTVQRVRKVGKVLKNKHIAPVKRKILEKERLNAIERYREMRKRKMKPFPDFEAE